MQSLAQAREVNADIRQILVTKNHKDSPTGHHSYQPRREEVEHKEEHKLKIETIDKKQSRSVHQKTEESENVEMPPKGKKSAVAKPSLKKVIKKPKEIKDESLKGRLERILSAKTDECNWGAQRKLVKEWGLTEKKVWGVSASMLMKDGILTYLSAPQIAKMGNLTDLAAKYIVRRFHDGKIWLDHLVEIKENLIHHVTGLPRTGERVPMDIPIEKMLREQLGPEGGMNSKGICIGQIKHNSVKWALMIISICLTNDGRPSSVKKEVLPVVAEISEKGTKYNWSKHVVDLLLENIKNCQDNGASIRFPSLSIWLAMTDITPVGEVEFTTTRQAFMFNFRSFSMNNPNQLIERTKMLFEQWFQNLKLKCGRWRVAQNVRRSLLGSAHVDLQLDHTRIWSGVDGARDADDLDYIPSVADIYAKLSQQTGHLMQPPMVAFSSYEQLSTLLTKAE